MRADQIDHAGKRRSAAQRAFAGALNRRAIGDRIAERHAQLDHIRAGFGGSQHDFLGRLERRIARGDVRDQAQLAGFGKRAKTSRDSPGGLWRRHCAFVTDAKFSDIARENFHIFIAAAGKIQDDDFVLLHLRRAANQFRQARAPIPARE